VGGRRALVPLERHLGTRSGCGSCASSIASSTGAAAWTSACVPA
jgi:hypothetical protein